MCNDSVHPLGKCDVYMRLDAKERHACVVKLGACFCCLGKSHRINDCSSKGKCLFENCERKHHTSLHEYYVKKNPGKERNTEAKREEPSEWIKSESKGKFNGVLDMLESCLLF